MNNKMDSICTQFMKNPTQMLAQYPSSPLNQLSKHVILGVSNTKEHADGSSMAAAGAACNGIQPFSGQSASR